MAGRGAFEAITRADMDRLHTLPPDQVWDFVTEEIVVFSVLMDKSWAAIHAALSDGNLYGDEGEYPLKMAVLGDHLLSRTETGDYLYLKHPEEVADIARSLRAMGRKRFEARYHRLPSTVEATGNEDFVFAAGQLDYVWPY